ncbi:hypothetical protein ACFL13_00020 [Patescibacteria group bacterium]
MDLLEELEKVKGEWGWKLSVDELVNFWYTPESLTVKHNLFKKIPKESYVASDNEKYRANILMEKVGLNEKLKNKFFSYQLGCTKREKIFFKKIIAELGVKPSGIAFIDDKEEYRKVAEECGIIALEPQRLFL